MAKEKRVAGEGTYYQLPNGSWRYRVMIDGKEYSGVGKTKPQAKAKVDRKLSQNNISSTDNSKLRLSAYLNEWIEWKKSEKSVKPQTIRLNRMFIELHIAPIIGDPYIGKITSEMVKQVIDTAKAKNLSYSSVKQIFDILNSSLKRAVEKNIIIRNPVISEYRPRKAQFINPLEEAEDIPIRKLIFTDEERKRFIEACSERKADGGYRHAHSGILLFMLNTGLRVGEAQAIKWTDIDFDTDEETKPLPLMRVSNTIVRYKDEDGKQVHTEQKQLKTKGSGRYVPLIKEAADALPPRQEKGYVFCVDGNTAKFYDQRSIHNSLKRIFRRAEIDWVENHAMHRLRHDFASRLIRNKTDVKTVSELLGHSCIQITLDIYTELFDEVKVREIRKLEL